MACESKKISELTEACLVNPNDILPIVQDGTNKYVKVKDLLKGKCGDDTQEDDCCCSKALSKAVTALDFSRTAMDLANKAFDKACQVDTKLGALEQRVTELELIICNIQSQITQIFNRFDQLEEGLTVTVVTTSETTLDKHEIKLGGITKGIIQVLRPTSNINQNGLGLPADAWQVRLALDGLKSEVTKNLTFVSGKFNNPGLTYNGTSPVSVNIPTALSLLDNDGNFLEGVRGHDGNLVQVVNHIAELGPLPTATSTVLGGIKVGYSQSGKKYPVKLDSNNKAYIDLTSLPTGAENLDDLGDVELTSPLDGDILYYDGTLKKWVNQSLKDLVESIIDCEYIQECISNFKVTPATHNKTATQTTAEYTVEATGAWTVAKESDPSNFITNFTTSGNDNGTITVTFGNNATLNTRTAKFIVTETATGRTARITINQSGVTPTVDRTITYNISGGQTNSIKVNNEIVGNGGQKTAPDGSNYTASLVSNDPGYKISSATPSAGTYNTSTGTLTINPITADATVQVVLELIPAGLVTITYTGDIDKVASGLPSGNLTIVSLGDSYTNTITPITGYLFNNIVISPSGTGDVTTGNISIPLVNANTTIEITASTTGHSLSINPTTISINSEGTSLPIEVTVTNNCSESSNITIDDSQLPQGITVTRDSQTGNLLVEADPGIPFGNYIVTITNECGDTAELTITTPLPYFDYSISEHSTGYFTPYGVPEEGTIEAVYAHHRDGFIDGVYNGITISHDTLDNSWNLTFPYPGQNGINDLEISYGGSESTNPRFLGTIIDNLNGTYTAKCAPVLGDLTTDSNYPIQAQNAADYEYGITVYVIVKGGSEFYNSYLHGVLDFAYVLAFGLDQINYHYYNYDTDYITYVNTSGETGKLIHGATIGGIPRSEFTLTLDLANTSSWIHNVDLTNETFDCDPGTAGTEGTIGFILNWNNPSSGSLSTTRTIKYIQE